MKVSVILPSVTAFAAAVGVTLLIAPKVSAQAIASAQVTTGATAEVERVIVTGSNIPTAQETGPNPVDTYRPTDLEKLLGPLHCESPVFRGLSDDKYLPD